MYANFDFFQNEISGRYTGESCAEDDPPALFLSCTAVQGALPKNCISCHVWRFTRWVCAACAAIFYGVCLPTTGCAAADEMMSCVDELMQLDCQDMSVCGNDCTLEDGDPVRISQCLISVGIANFLHIILTLFIHMYLRIYLLIYYVYMCTRRPYFGPLRQQ